MGVNKLTTNIKQTVNILENYFTNLKKSRAIQINQEKKILKEIEFLKQCSSSVAETGACEAKASARP